MYINQAYVFIAIGREKLPLYIALCAELYGIIAFHFSTALGLEIQS